MPETDIDTERQVRRLEEQFKRLTITDSEGDLESGFVISRFPTEAIGACCLGSDCQLLSARDCGNIGGIYHGDQSPCDPNPCVAPPPTGACCFVDGSCVIHTSVDCGNAGGTYQGDGTICSPNPCPSAEIRRCCFCDEATCEDLSASDCATAGGQWGTSGETCAGCSGGTPCCRRWRVTGTITGTITYDDGVNAACTYNINDTLTDDSFCQDSGCDNAGYPGCCIALTRGGIGPVHVVDHTVSLGISGNDNFNGTMDLGPCGMQIVPDTMGFCNPTSVAVSVSQSDVGCNSNPSLSGSSSGTSGFTYWSLSITITFIEL